MSAQTTQTSSLRDSYTEKLLRGQDDLLLGILEGDARSALRQIGRMLTISLPCLAAYGGTMGLYQGGWQILSTIGKVPALLYGTLLASFPVLHVFNVLVGSRVGFVRTFALTLTAVTTTSILLGAFAPISFVFNVRSRPGDYAFLQLFHVSVFAVAGVFGGLAMYRALCLVCEKSDIYPRTGLRLLKVWILVFGFVGIQVAWSLRPFVGDPVLPPEGLRDEQYETVYTHLIRLPGELGE